MEIVFIVSEMVPFAKTGGLGDVGGTLPHAIAKLGHSVSVFLPKYKTISGQKYPFKLVYEPLHIPLGSDVETGKVFSARFNEINVFLIDEPSFFDRDGIYGTPKGDYPDNDKRFAFFQRASLEALKKLKIRPDVIHCNDWQSGLISVYLKTLYRADPFFSNTKTVFTIHNLAYQGNFPPDSISTTGISWDEFRHERLEFYGKLSFLKGGLVYSDVLTTVSERYAQEIQSKDFGCGMEGVLSGRKNDLHGILNGINLEEWDPAHDPELAQNFDARSIEKKLGCKTALQKESGLTQDPKAPLFGFVGRLTDQKGVDLLEPILEEIAREGWQLILLGSGDEAYQERLRRVSERYAGSIRSNITFDVTLSKRIYAGSDIFLLPSRFEPCGLGQMISFRYGTVPLVREVGGLADTVQEFDPKTGKGNGFSFLDYTPDALLETMRKAARLYKDPKQWSVLVANGMKADFSWHVSAEKYVDLYQKVERKPIGV